MDREIRAAERKLHLLQAQREQIEQEIDTLKWEKRKLSRAIQRSWLVYEKIQLELQKLIKNAP